MKKTMLALMAIILLLGCVIETPKTTQSSAPAPTGAEPMAPETTVPSQPIAAPAPETTPESVTQELNDLLNDIGTIEKEIR